ncbi:Os04g0633400, partial [Oryza sativa Japonica Group]
RRRTSGGGRWTLLLAAGATDDMGVVASGRWQMAAAVETCDGAVRECDVDDRGGGGGDGVDGGGRRRRRRGDADAAADELVGELRGAGRQQGVVQ